MKNHSVASIANGLIVGVVALGFMGFSISRGDYLASNLLVLLWVILSIAFGFLIHFANRRGISIVASARWLGFGMLATAAAFALQGIVNGSLLAALGSANASSPPGAMALGAGAAFCQTLGKAVAIGGVLLILKSRKPDQVFAGGLGVGLGFGIMEVLLLAVQVIVAGQHLSFGGALVERISAVTFHIYSGGLIATAFILRSLWPAVAVLAIHTLMDGTSTAWGKTLEGFPIQIVFLVLAVACWLAWLGFSRPNRLNDSNAGRSQN